MPTRGFRIRATTHIPYTFENFTESDERKTELMLKIMNKQSIKLKTRQRHVIILIPTFYFVGSNFEYYLYRFRGQQSGLVKVATGSDVHV